MTIYQGRKSPLIMLRSLIRTVMATVALMIILIAITIGVGVSMQQLRDPPHGELPRAIPNTADEWIQMVREFIFWVGPYRLLTGALITSAALGTLFFFRSCLEWLRFKYTITDRSVIYEYGLFDYQSEAISIKSIESVGFRYGGILNRLLGLGFVNVFTRDRNLLRVGPIHGAYFVAQQLQHAL